MVSAAYLSFAIWILYHQHFGLHVSLSSFTIFDELCLVQVDVEIITYLI